MWLEKRKEKKKLENGSDTKTKFIVASMRRLYIYNLKYIDVNKKTVYASKYVYK